MRREREGGREEREGGRRGREGGEGGREGRERAREVAMGTGINTESSNILQEVCQSRSAPAECVREDRSREAEQNLGDNWKTGGKGCGNGR